MKRHGDHSSRLKPAGIATRKAAPYPLEVFRMIGDFFVIRFRKWLSSSWRDLKFPNSEISDFPWHALLRISEFINRVNQSRQNTIQISDKRYRNAYFLVQNRVRTGHFLFRFSEMLNPKGEMCFRNQEKGKKKAEMGFPFSWVRNRESEKVNLISGFGYRVSQLGFTIADIGFRKSFFAEFLRLEDFSFTTSSIRHRNGEFALPISEIRYHPWRGI